MIIKNIILKYRIYFIVGLIIAILIPTLMFKKGNVSKSPIVVDALELDNDKKEEINLETYSVDVKGAVKKPGVYKVVSGSNVADVIEIAGGLKSSATTDNINLSKKVTDEMVIYVYTKTEYKKITSNNNATQSNNVVTKTSECKETTSTPEISSCISKDATIITNNTNSNNSIEENTTQTPNEESTTQNENALININTASKEELMTLTGIGESKANCIITYRSEVGLFNTIEEIKNVSGIGDALFAKIKDRITV